MAKRTPLSCSGDQQFFCCNGDIYSTPEELCKGLKKMSKEDFSHHCNADKCDFAAWTEHVLKKKTAAKKLNKCKTKTAMAKCVTAELC